jgi:nucleotide-binding universal stress UspA family protein
MMGKILCATRGGEASYRTQDAAIALAKEQGGRLVFVYVSDLHFLDKTAEPIVVDAENEVTKMGQFLLLMAKERAAEQGIEAETVLYEGNVREELMKAVTEQGATLVILGKPADTESVFKNASLEKFAAGITEETGVDTRIL